jgi:tetratricopeptide (TPR) repeat protein
MSFARLVILLLCAVSLVAQTASTSAPPDLLKTALDAYRKGKFEAAVVAYQLAIKQDPKSGDAYAGLARTYLKQQNIELAAETAAKGTAEAPDSPMTHTALGEVLFRQGRIAEAEKEWVKAVNVPHPDARACLGLAILSDAYSLHARARRMLEKAHQLDANDPDIQWRWFPTLKRAERIRWLESYLAGPTNDDPDERESLQEMLSYLKEREKQPNSSCKLVNKLTSTDADLKPLLTDPRHLHAYGLNVKINGQSSKLMLDTGASGLLINRKLAERAGIESVHATEIYGIGDKGPGKGYVGYAKSIKIGELEFQDCLVRVSEKRSILNDDGLIGANVFARYLVTIDFPAEKLRLQELPERPGEKEAPVTLSTGKEDAASSGQEGTASTGQATSSGPQDAYIAPEMKSYTKVFRFGHQLLIPTMVGKSEPKLFLIDTGSMRNNISPQAAREVTKIHDDPNMRVHGLSGAVKDVYSADKAVLQFSHFRQENQDIITIDLSGISRGTGTEVSGILGFTTLRFMVVKIDYRDGLVDFEYKGPKF